MYLRLMSRLTLFFICCFLFLIERGIAQQKQNDFTKRLFGVDGLGANLNPFSECENEYPIE